MLHWLKMHFIPHEGNGHRPHILHTRNVHRLIGLVMFVEVFAFLIPTIAFVGRADNGTILPSVLSQLTNQARAAQNLPPLTIDPKLNEAAQAKANDMARNSYFAHTSPDGKTPWYWIEQAGYSYSHAGENLAVNFTDAQDVANAWMNSPEHRANILKADYSEVGTGVAEGIYQGYGTIFVAQDFGTPIAPTVLPVVTSVPSANSPLITSQKTAVLGAQTSVVIKQVTKRATATPAVSAKAEPVAAPVAPREATVATAPVIHPTLLQRLESSPRNTANVMLSIVLIIVLLAVFLNIGIKFSHQHPDLILNGVMVVALIGTVFVMNNYISQSTVPLSQSLDYDAQHQLL